MPLCRGCFSLALWGKLVFFWGTPRYTGCLGSFPDRGRHRHQADAHAASRAAANHRPQHLYRAVFSWWCMLNAVSFCCRALGCSLSVWRIVTLSQASGVLFRPLELKSSALWVCVLQGGLPQLIIKRSETGSNAHAEFGGFDNFCSVTGLKGKALALAKTRHRTPTRPNQEQQQRPARTCCVCCSSPFCAHCVARPVLATCGESMSVQAARELY